MCAMAVIKLDSYGPRLICSAGSILTLAKFVPLYRIRTGNIYSDLCYKPLYISSDNEQNNVLLLESVLETKISTGVGDRYHSHYGWSKVLYNEETYWLDGRHVASTRARVLYCP